MLVEMPFATGDQVALDFRPGQAIKAKSALETLRRRGVLSEGLIEPLRDDAGRVQGQLHLFCSLGRDAARYEALGEHARAVRLAKRARKLEARADAKRLVKAIAATRCRLQDARPIGIDQALTRSIEDPKTARALRTYATAVAKARDELRVDAQTTTGRVTAMVQGLAHVEIGDASSVVPVPADHLPEEAIGMPVTLRWADIGNGILITVDIAVDVPGQRDEGMPDDVPNIYPFVRPLHQPIAIPAGAARNRALARSRRVNIDS